jgi:carbon-monoxide dehydrogenase large subunit
MHSRDQTHEVEVGFDGEGRILALLDRFTVDCGAWNPIGAGVVYNTAVHLLGPYKIDAVAIEARIAATNKVPNAPYRGAGRPEAAFAMERTIDLVAGVLGLKPAEVRLRNMIRADEMPYRMGIPYRDGEPIVYDGGDYQARCARRRRSGGVAAFRERRHARTAAPVSASLRRRGTGWPVRERDRADRSFRQDSHRPAPARRAKAWRRSSRRSQLTPGPSP